MKTRAHYIAGFVLIALMWGGSFLAIRFSIDAFPPFAAASMRVGIATAIMWLLMTWRRENETTRAVVCHLLGIGCFTLGIPWALLFWGEQFVSPALSSIINSTTPIFTVVITALFTTHEEIRWNKWAGVVVGFVGVVVIFLPALMRGEEGRLLGMAAIVGMAICYAVGIVWLKHVAHRVAPAPAFFYQGIGALVLLVPLSLFAEWGSFASSRWTSIEGWIAISYLGVFSTALAQLIFFVLVREWGSVKASAVTYFIPLVAVMLDWIVFGTWVSVYALIGGAVVLVGVRLIHVRARKSVVSVAEGEGAYGVD